MRKLASTRRRVLAEKIAMNSAILKFLEILSLAFSLLFLMFLPLELYQRWRRGALNQVMFNKIRNWACDHQNHGDLRFRPLAGRTRSRKFCGHHHV